MSRLLPRAANVAVAALVLVLVVSGCGDERAPGVAFPNTPDADRAAVGALLNEDFPAAARAYDRFTESASQQHTDVARAALDGMRAARDAAEKHLKEVRSSSKAVTALERYQAALTAVVPASEGMLDISGGDARKLPMLRRYRVARAFREASQQMIRSEREILRIMLQSASASHRETLRSRYGVALSARRTRLAAPEGERTTTMRSLLHKGFRDASDEEVEAAVVLSQDLRVLDRIYDDLFDARLDWKDREATALQSKATTHERAMAANLTVLEKAGISATYEELVDSTVGYVDAIDDLVVYVDSDPKRNRQVHRTLVAALDRAAAQRAGAEAELRLRLATNATADERDFLKRQAAKSPVRDEPAARRGER